MGNQSATLVLVGRAGPTRRRLVFRAPSPPFGGGDHRHRYSVRATCWASVRLHLALDAVCDDADVLLADRGRAAL